MLKNFVFVSPLSVSGEFALPLPKFAPRNSLAVQVSNLLTYNPLPYQRTFLKDDKSYRVFKMDLDTSRLPSDEYSSQDFYKRLKDTTDRKLEDVIDNMYDNEKECISLFDAKKVNSFYRAFEDYDVVLLLEYATYLNTNSRLVVLQKHSASDMEKCFAWRSYEAAAYGFNLGYEYDSVDNTLGTLGETVWTKFSNRFIDVPGDYGINAMIRYAVMDFGGFQCHRIPDPTPTVVKRNGFGFYVVFDKLGTCLVCTVIAGRLPYIIEKNDMLDPNLSLLDRDYDFTLNQPVMVLRNTKSRLAVDAEEYVVDAVTSGFEKFRKNFAETGSRNSEFSSFTKSLSSDFLFDCPLGADPLMDELRNGLNLINVTYGGFALWYLAYLCYFYYVGIKGARDRNFFMTPIMLMNYFCGTLYSDAYVHGMYPHQEDGKGGYKKDKMYYLCNPRFNRAERLCSLNVYRKRSEAEKLNDLRSFDRETLCVVLETVFGGKKYVLSKYEGYERALVQVYPVSLEEMPVPDVNQMGVVTYAAKVMKPIVFEEPFSFVYAPDTNVLYKNEIRFKFRKLDERGIISDMRFSEGDKVMIKGSFNAI